MKQLVIARSILHFDETYCTLNKHAVLPRGIWYFQEKWTCKEYRVLSRSILYSQELFLFFKQECCPRNIMFKNHIMLSRNVMYVFSTSILYFSYAPSYFQEASCTFDKHFAFPTMNLYFHKKTPCAFNWHLVPSRNVLYLQEATHSFTEHLVLSRSILYFQGATCIFKNNCAAQLPRKQPVAGHRRNLVLCWMLHVYIYPT